MPRVPELPWSVQVGAFTLRTEAARSVRLLVRRGYEARVDGAGAPFRVRVGRYASKAEAAAALGRMKKQKLSGAVVRAGGVP